MGKSNRNSKIIIKNDVKFINAILRVIKRQDLPNTKYMFETWKCELLIIRFLCQHPIDKPFTPTDIIRYVDNGYSELNLGTLNFTTVYNYINLFRLAHFITKDKHNYYVGNRFINLKTPKDKITSTVLRVNAYPKYSK